MKGFYVFAGLFLSLFDQASATLDVITLTTSGSTYIQEASATLVVGNIPNPITGDIALWSAIMMNGKDFLQGVTDNTPSSSYCPNLGNYWCNFAYMLIGSTTPKVGSTVKTNPGSQIRTHYKIDPSTKNWVQDVYVNAKLASTVTSSKLHQAVIAAQIRGSITDGITTGQGQVGTIFYVSVECASGTCATTPAHSWQDMSIVLNQADLSFGRSGPWAGGATGGQMSTPDGGKTWNFTTLSIPNVVVQH